MEALDNSMCDIMNRQDLPFGGMTVVFGGDSRQVLPVVSFGLHEYPKAGTKYEDT
jgi:hypothetical protein